MAKKPDDPLEFEDKPTFGSRLLDILAAGAQGYGQGAGNSNIPEAAFARAFSGGYAGGKESAKKGRLSKALEAYRSSPEYETLDNTERTAYRVSPEDFLNERGVKRAKTGKRTFVGVQDKDAIIMDEDGTFTRVPLPSDSPLRPKNTPEKPIGRSLVYDPEKNQFFDASGTPVLDPNSNDRITKRTAPGGANASANQLPILDQMEKLISGKSSGMLGQAKKVAANMTGGKSDSDIKTYNDMRNASAAGIYRAVTKDTRLSDADAASRALPMMPDFYDSEETKKKKFAFIRAAIEANSGKAPALPDGGGATSFPSSTTKTFGTEAEAQAAEDAGVIRSGDKITVGGVTGVWE